MLQEIDKVLNYNLGNVMVYNNLCKDVLSATKIGTGIMPFIGDGLSKFAFGEKEGFIDDILNIMTESLSIKDSQKLRNRVKSDDFLESLENLKDALGGKYGETIINEYLEEFYSDKNIDEYLLENQVVRLVPLLSNGDSITINFDHVLELAYELAGINPAIATPYDCKILNSKIRSKEDINRALLFKIHGDIVSDATERIITKAAFEKNYKRNTKFTENLIKWIQKYKLLFIGVDLLKDKYLRGILEKTKSEGINHYAIVGCKDDEKAKKEVRDQLAEINILPIIYNIENPGCIEVILHKILVDTKSKIILNKFVNSGEFHYKYSEHDLVGRENEIEKLEEFLVCESDYLFDFKWWMIWGKDISGKSKLAYDFARRYAQSWDWYMINPGQIDEFMNKQIDVYKNKNKKRDVFIIFDDFDCYCGGLVHILDFIKRINVYCSRLRILFIVRDENNCEIGDIIYDRLRRDEIRVMLMRTLYARPREIKQLPVNDIKEICYRYIWYRKKDLELENLKEEDFSKIDAELERYINDLISEGESLLLLCCLEKAISLIINNTGGFNSGLSNKEIVNRVMRYILTDGEGYINNPNVDILEIEKRKEPRKEQGKKLMEKFDKNKEYGNGYSDKSYGFDEFIFKTEKE